MKKSTIKDVAKLADVSVATVSRTLNNPDSVRENTREKVVKAIETLEYDPNPVARALRSNKVKSIGIVVPNITNTSMAEMTRGVHEELVDQGYNTVLFNSNEDFEQEQYFCEILKNTMVDGAIFFPGTGGTPPVENLVPELAVCLINRATELKEVDQIMADEKQGMELLAYHLHRIGHEKIAFITGNYNTSATQNKIKGYRNFFNRVNLPVREEYISTGHWTIDGAYMAMRELLSQKHIPTAVIVGTDTMALGVLSAIEESGLSIPDDIAITGFDNSPNSKFYYPPLTTLKYPNYEMGKLAARSIMKRLKRTGLEKKVINLSLDILIRKSCGYWLNFDRKEE
ncbi:MAG: LacI family DNA-binding transcriptional regulator [Halanaerobiales bacterium]